MLLSARGSIIPASCDGIAVLSIVDVFGLIAPGRHGDWRIELDGDRCQRVCECVKDTRVSASVQSEPCSAAPSRELETSMRVDNEPEGCTFKDTGNSRKGAFALGLQDHKSLQKTRPGLHISS